MAGLGIAAVAEQGDAFAGLHQIGELAELGLRLRRPDVLLVDAPQRVAIAGARYDNVANTQRLGGYATTDLRASYAFAPGWVLEGRLANVFDRRYETVYYFNQPGRSWYLTLRYRPGA